MIRQLARTAKSGLATILELTGTLDLILDRKLAGRVAVIMYHRVIADHVARQTDSNPGIIVSKGQFEQQMATIREEFNPLSLNEFQSHVENETAPPRRSCLITFDDGWIDNYEIAFPILRKYSIPAVIFLPCDYISTDRTFWQEEMLMRLTRMLSSGNGDAQKALGEILASRDNGFERTIDGIRLFVISMKHESQGEIESLLEEIRLASEHCVDGKHYNKHLTWEQVRDMQDAGVTFASHALSHRLLTTLDPEERRRELETSQRVLEKMLGHPVSAIAYPNGDFDEGVLRSTREAGYTLGFSTEHGVFEIGNDPLAIPRFNLHDRNGGTRARFMCTIGGIL